jgi:thymidylate synthase
MDKSIEKQYLELLQDILDNGVEKDTRNGKTLSVFGRQIRYKFKDGKFPLLTTKKMYFKGIVTELLWFLRGDTNIKFLVDNDCHIWDGDAYKSYLSKWNYESFPNDGSVVSIEPIKVEPHTKEQFIYRVKTDNEFAKKWGELGPVYGRQWRAWGGYDKVPRGYEHGAVSHFRKIAKFDQIANLINDLKTNPDSRRLLVSAWNISDLPNQVLPPCHYGFQVYTRELSIDERQRLYFETCNRLKTPSIKGSTNKETMENHFQEYNIPARTISLMFNMRSVDTFLGLPFNIASYGLLLEIIAKEVNMVPDELIGNLGDTHLYLNHIEQAKEQIGRELTLEERKKVWEENNFGQDISWHSMNDGDVLELLNEDNIPHRTREPYPLPKLFFKYEKETYVNDYELDGFILKDYQSHPAIKAPLSN